ncbi:putative lipoprotein YiaD precursor [compost metagenome]
MVLRQDAQRLDHYYRQGEPWSLGIGLYQGERLRPSLLAAINGHRIPTVPQGLPDKPRTVRLDSLSLFNSGSAQLKPESTKFLVNAFAGIKAQPGWLIVITGHTDATGSDEQNLRLSRARAAAVHDWIQHMGDIPSNCFAVQGLGASEPVASNDTEQGRSANRRVEIRLVPEAGACQSSTTASGLQPLSHFATPNA